MGVQSAAQRSRLGSLCVAGGVTQGRAVLMRRVALPLCRPERQQQGPREGGDVQAAAGAAGGPQDWAHTAGRQCPQAEGLGELSPGQPVPCS